jgi:hypothetical protein
MIACHVVDVMSAFGLPCLSVRGLGFKAVGAYLAGLFSHFLGF